MLRRSLLLAPAALAMQPGKATAALIAELTGPHLSIYIQALSEAPNIGRLAVVDPSGGIFARAPKMRPFQDASEMMRAMKPQLVVIALEAHHAPAAIRIALENGAHVLAEKPACTRASDFAALAALAAEHRRYLMLAFATRLYPVALRARQLFDEGRIGKLYGATMHYIADQARLTRPEYQRSWFSFKDKAGGGHLIWLGIHYIDLLQFLTSQRITLVTAQIANAGGQPIEVEDSAALTFQLEGGALGTMQSGYYLDKGYHNGITLWGSKGWLRFDPAAGNLEWYTDGGSARKETLPKIDGYPVLVRTAADIAAGRAKPFITADECLQTLRVVFAAYKSARTGRMVAAF